MKTAQKYLEETGLDKTYWGDKIIEAEKRGEFYHHDAYQANYDWFSCACGKLDKRIPRGKSGCPDDKRLELLGYEFGDYVMSNEFLLAAQILQRIQKREIELLDL